MDLEAPETEVLLKAARKYRASLPSYLQSAQPELSVLDALIEKLEALGSR